MAMMPGMDSGVSGKRLIPQLTVGCLLFSVIMGVGTYMIAKWTTPFFERMSAPSREKLEKQLRDKKEHNNPTGLETM